MNKKNTLFCIVLQRKDQEAECVIKTYRVSTLSPDEVAVPDNTMMYTFFEDETPEEVLSKFAFLKFKDNFLLNHVIMNLEFFDGNKIYVIGEKVVREGIKYCYNATIGSLIPIKGNMEIVS